MRIVVGWLLGIVSGIGMAFAGPAWAERPSLEGVEGQIEDVRDWFCTRAEFEGETFRPNFCDPSCDCLSGLDLTSYETVMCVESPSSEFTLSGENSFGTCSLSGCSALGWCPEGSGQACDPQACPAGEVCVGGGILGFCRKLCSSDAQCNGTVPNYCTGSSLTPCVDDTPCQAQEFCTQGQCRRTCPCTQTTSYTLVNVKAADSVQPAVCAGQQYNSADLLQCLSEFETLHQVQCQTICGNGEQQLGETCDDGNTTPGDGCNENCQLE